MKAEKWRHLRLLRILALPALTALLASLSGCSSVEREELSAKAPEGGILLKGGGATFPSPLYKKWFAIYQDSHPGIAVAYDAVGSGEGVRRFIGSGVAAEQKVDFGASDAAMTDQQIAEVSRGVLLLPATAGSVVLAYNLPSLQGELRLSRKAYSGIFLGEIKNWSDPLIAQTNPGMKLPNLTIVTVVRQDSSGTTFALTKNLDAVSEEWRARYGAATVIDWPGGAMRATGNEKVAGRIQQSVGSIGYVGYEFAHNLGLKMAVLQNRNGNFVAPTDETAKAALAAVLLPDNLKLFVADPEGPDAYPIVTFSWILLYKNYDDNGKAKMIRDLFRWCLQDGQQFAPQLGFVRLPPNVTSKALEALGTITPGD